jgi:acyl carrier protein
MTRSQLLEVIAELIEDVTGAATTITEETVPDDVDGWDSLRHLTLIAAIEERFDLVLSPDEQSEMLSVDLILDVVGERVGASS